MMRTLLMLLAATFAVLMTLTLAQAQTPPTKSPLGIGAPPSLDRGLTAQRGLVPAQRQAAQPGGFFGHAWLWILEQQQRLTRELAAAVRALKTGNPLVATGLLAFVSFTYGVLHAAGPGHGKAVISSYVLATDRTVRRGILLSFLAALFQAISAIVIVGILAILLKATSLEMRATEAWIETVSWGFVAAVGAWLLIGQLRALLTRGQHVVSGDGGHLHYHGPEAHASTGDHAHSHEHCDACGHAHMPAAHQLEGSWSWRKALALAGAVGIRPCTGAILVLIFALSQGLFWAGVFATFAMALGTAITVSVLAVLAVGSRELATRIAGGEGRWAMHVGTAASLLGSTLVLVLGTAFFLASLKGTGPL